MTSPSDQRQHSLSFRDRMLRAAATQNTDETGYALPRQDLVALREAFATLAAENASLLRNAMTDRMEEIEAAWDWANSGPSAHVRDDVYSWACNHGDWLIGEVKRLTVINEGLVRDYNHMLRQEMDRTHERDQLRAENEALRAVVDAAQAYAVVVRRTHGLHVPWEALESLLAALDQQARPS